MSDELPPPPGQGPPPAGWAPPPPGSPSGELADWGQRALGYLVDFAFGISLVIVGVILAAILGAVSSTLGFLVALIAYIGSFAYWIIQIIKQGRTGQTIGMKIIGLRLVYETSGETLGGGSAFIRSIAHVVDSLICYIGWLFPLWDTKRQTIADKIMATIVVQVPKQPFNAVDLYSTS